MSKDLKAIYPTMKHFPLKQLRVMLGFNARSKEELTPKDKQFQELVESIRDKGVLQPIIVRQMSEEARGKALVRGKKHTHEVVAGERRFRAARLAGYDKIPAIVKVLTDEEAYEIMLTENMERKDLTPYDEAKGIKRYLDKYGMDKMEDLADKLNRSVGFIRKRASIMALPGALLVYWRDGKIPISWLNELICAPTEIERQTHANAVLDKLNEGDIRYFDKDNIRRMIRQNLGLKLSYAHFDQKKAGCLQCANNTGAQFQLFDIGNDDPSECIVRECFFRHEKKVIRQVNSEIGDLPIRIFKHEMYWNEANDRQLKRLAACEEGKYLTEKCETCGHLAVLVDPDDDFNIRAYICLEEETVCRSAHIEIYQKAEIAKKAIGLSPEDAASISNPKASRRAAIHGQEFREAFYKEAIPAKFSQLDAQCLEAVHLTLYATILGNWKLKEWFSTQMRIKDSQHMDLLANIKILSAKSTAIMQRDVVRQIIMDSSVAHKERHAVGQYIGINLAEEWSITEEYLRKKHKSELLSMITKFNLLKNTKVVIYLNQTLGTTTDNIETLKKTQLIDIFVKTGIDLHGMVPNEILQVKSIA